VALGSAQQALTQGCWRYPIVIQRAATATSSSSLNALAQGC